MKTWRSSSSEARLRAIQVKQKHPRQMKIYLALFTILLLVYMSNNKEKKLKKTSETMFAMSDFEMEGPEASKTQATWGPFLESPDN